MTRSKLFLGTVFLSLFALQAAAQAERGAEDYEKVDQFAHRPLGLEPILALEDLRKIGTLKNETFRTVENIHDRRQVDEVRTLTFDGLTIYVLFPARVYRRGLIGEVVVSKRHWEMGYGIRVGSSARDVQTALGEPDEREQDKSKYCGDISCVTFIFRGDRVIRAIFKTPPN